MGYVQPKGGWKDLLVKMKVEEDETAGKRAHSETRLDEISADSVMMTKLDADYQPSTNLIHCNEWSAIHHAICTSQRTIE